MTRHSTHHPTDSTPIACTLTGGALAERTAWIADLNRSFLRAHRQDGGVLEMAYAPAALPRLRELVRREAECCAFLRIELADEGDPVRLRIAVPAAALELAPVLFAPFVAGTSVGDAGGGDGPGPSASCRSSVGS